MKVALSIFALASFAMPSEAQDADGDYNKMGKLAYAQWECAALAAKTEKYQKIGLYLFESGHQKLTGFVTAWNEGKLTEEDTDEVPIGISLRLIRGPTVDFSLGYMWAQFLAEAEEKTFDSDLQAPYEELRELQMITAEEAYREKKCDLLVERED
ncbi:hypothetical protein K1T73_05765 [Roseovarius sp. SCSIO 43702]|uniref:hypothetical protein n=1 Tax=Roseovarius sp. SCSIO 43702 TaxID=2823043 RepID=UPI001C7351CB|nr:hypothetical protein [Roseovarius sp. SCSIO 43702]QYX57894.1 hypothetical protein K1T73_05765 [Roseovarius sp. SCSIO 43702]